MPNQYHMESTAKLRWHCRRGTKELDYLLEDYLDNLYCKASDQEKTLFKELLTLEDSQLIWFLLGDRLPDSKGLATLVKKIRKNKNI